LNWDLIENHKSLMNRQQFIPICRVASAFSRPFHHPIAAYLNRNESDGIFVGFLINLVHSFVISYLNSVRLARQKCFIKAFLPQFLMYLKMYLLPRFIELFGVN
jgi:hypothetical protein